MEQFKIINKIGEGAYSTVYTVKRIEDDKIYALKKVKIKKLSKKEQSNALNEVRILASVNSPYVIGYRESFIDEAEQTLCIVMEYADDGDLYQKIKLYIKNKTFFMEHDIWRIFIQITKGLHDLHEYNILHRDLKSANVFLFRDGTAKLGDLNVSKITSRGLGYTQTGTPYYASPEVWKDKPYDLKSDIWSLGCVFYELIMLTTPFKAKSMKELYEKVKKGEYPPIPNTFSPKFQIIIDRILKIRPEERPDARRILNMPEILDKIEDLQIFNDNNKKSEKKNKNEIYFETAYKINKRLNYFGKVDDSVIFPTNEVNKNNSNDNNIKNYNSKNMNINENIIMKKIKLKDGKYNKFRKGKEIMNVNKSVELNNKINYNLRKKYEIVNIYKKNIKYFEQKYNQKMKIVLKTIKYPKELKYLKNQLPGVRYNNNNCNESKENNKNKEEKNDSKIFFPIHQLFPKIKPNKQENDKKSEIYEIKDETIDVNGSKINYINDSNNEYNNNKKFFIMNTLQQQINEKNIFNNKGKIDIKIKE